VFSCLVSPVASDILRDHLGIWLNRRDLAVRKALGDLLDQDEVNVLVHGSRWARTPAAERGQPVTPTLELVAMALRNASSCLSASEAGRLCGLSSVTTRRYLNQLVDEGRAVMSLQYGRTGRPRHLYRWIG
jgi:response regulator of citrate/malate metabolism